MNISETINSDIEGNSGSKINLVIITDFMPKCNRYDKYATVAARGRMTMKEYFEDIFMKIPVEIRANINPVWISLFEEIKDEVDMNDLEYVERRIVEVFEKVVATDVHHIILAMPKSSPLREKIVFQQYKTFPNQNGNKYVKFRTKSGEVITNKLVGFMDTLFPYEFIPETYIAKAQQLLDLMGLNVDFFEYKKEQKKQKDKKTI